MVCTRMIAQPQQYRLFVEIFGIAADRQVPDWVFANIERGIELASREHYVNAAELMNMSSIEDGNEIKGWDAAYFVNDRNKITSFIGSITELAWVLSHTDAELAFMLPCLTKREQVDQALDFYLGDNAYQLKTVQFGSSGVDLLVKDEYLVTTADFLVLIEPINALSYTMSITQWHLLKDDMCLWDPCEKKFWVRPKDFLEYGGVITQLPEFVKRARPPKVS